MDSTRSFLESIGLPPGDLTALPDSPKRFPDGASFRIEIPSTEGPRCLEAVLDEADDATCLCIASRRAAGASS